MIGEFNPNAIMHAHYRGNGWKCAAIVSLLAGIAIVWLVCEWSH